MFKTFQCEYLISYHLPYYSPPEHCQHPKKRLLWIYCADKIRQNLMSFCSNSLMPYCSSGVELYSLLPYDMLMQKTQQTYHIATFGCQANISDSERVAAVLELASFQKARGEEHADVLVYNTCSVRQAAEDRVFGRNKRFRELRAKRPHLKVVLTGCMMHHRANVLKSRLPEVDIFIPIRDLMHLPEKLGKKIQEQPEEYLSFTPQYTSTFRAYVPISFGCNNFCTFCIVPFSRGREYSRPAEEILSEVRILVEKNYKEIWLLGQNVNSYGITELAQKTVWDNKTRKGAAPQIQEGRMTFADLLRAVNAVSGDFWIRFTSPHPKDFSDDLISAIAECKKMQPYINLPVQSGDNEVLGRMNRTYTRERYLALVEKIRAKNPDIAISTDTIVGFPGETEEQFQNTIALYKEIGFDMAFISEYSQREKTAAALAFKDDVPREVKKERRERLTDVLRESALVHNKRLIGTTTRVLADEQKNNKFFGKTPENKTVALKLVQHSVLNKKTPSVEQALTIGNFVNVKITEAESWRLVGEIIGT